MNNHKASCSCRLLMSKQRFSEVREHLILAAGTQLCLDSKQLFMTLNLWQHLCDLSLSILTSSSSQGCHEKLVLLFSEKLYLIGLAALVVAAIMVTVSRKIFIISTVFYGIQTCWFISPVCLHSDLWDDLHHGALLWDQEQPRHVLRGAGWSTSEIRVSVLLVAQDGYNSIVLF